MDQNQKIKNSEKEGWTTFGNNNQFNGKKERIKNSFGEYLINGDGTLIDIHNNLIWIRSPWGTTWTGDSFIETPVEVTWHQATKL